MKSFIIFSLDTLDLPIIEKGDFKNSLLGNYQIPPKSVILHRGNRETKLVRLLFIRAQTQESVFQRVIGEKDIQRPIVLRATIYTRSAGNTLFMFQLISEEKELSQ